MSLINTDARPGLAALRSGATCTTTHETFVEFLQEGYALQSPRRSIMEAKMRDPHKVKIPNYLHGIFAFRFIDFVKIEAKMDDVLVLLHLGPLNASGFYFVAGTYHKVGAVLTYCEAATGIHPKLAAEGIQGFLETADATLWPVKAGDELLEGVQRV